MKLKINLEFQLESCAMIILVSIFLILLTLFQNLAEHNGVAKHKNKHLIEITHTLLIYGGVPQ